MGNTKSRWKRFKSAMASAFIIDEESEWAPNEKQIEIVDKLAQWVVRRRLTLPAIMTLESIMPLNYLGSQALVFFQPFVAAFLETSDYRQFQEMLEHRPSIRYMIEVLEDREEDFTARQKADKQKRKEAAAGDNKE